MKFSGIMPALITPLTPDGKLNVKVLEQLMEHLIEQGADGFYIGGATGEGIILDKDVMLELTRESVRIAAGRVPCIVHVARMNYQEMLEIARYADQVGADAVSAIPPIFYPYTQEEIHRYYQGLSDAINIPIMIYNNPNTGVTFSPEQVTELFEIEHVDAIKWTNSNYFAVMELVVRTEGKINIVNGPDEMLLCGLAAGCDGGIGTTYNVMLPWFKEIYRLFKAGEIEAAQKLQHKVSHIIAVMLPYNALYATKAVLEAQGFDVCHSLYPKKDCDEATKKKLFSELREAGLEL